MTIKLYKIVATVTDATTEVLQTSAEVLGEAYGVAYGSLDEAHAVRDALEETKADEALSYEVEVVEVRVTDVKTSTDADGATTIHATVKVDQRAAIATEWSVQPRHTTAGVDGWEPAGDAPDHWIDSNVAALVTDAGAMALGLEIIAGAS